MSIFKTYFQLTLKHPRYKSVDYTKLTPILVEAVKELNAKIIELQSAQEENKILSSRLERLETAVKSLTMEKSSVGDKSLGELR